MKRVNPGRRRPSVHITLGRAARLRRLVVLLAEHPRSREVALSAIGIGLRTFYRELELLKRCGVKVLFKDKSYSLQVAAEAAEGLLPFPDPQLSFAEMAELSRLPGEAAARLASLLASVVNAPAAPKRTSGRRKAVKGRGADGERRDEQAK